jgi:ABC-type Co2+ transport system permease subunit
MSENNFVEKTGYRKCRQLFFRDGVLMVLLIILHSILLHAMAGGTLVSIIFTGSAGVQIGHILVVLCFLITRILVVLALPGLILADIGIILLTCYQRRK